MTTRDELRTAFEKWQAGEISADTLQDLQQDYDGEPLDRGGIPVEALIIVAVGIVVSVVIS
jgi:hypothetical protein